jgi:hypothetical protein
MRRDAIGFFWQDLPLEKKPKKDVIKRTPPARTWELPDYLPGLDEAIVFEWDECNITILQELFVVGEQFVFDIESYPNYFLAAFKGIKSGKIFCFELSETDQFDRDLLRHLLEQFLTIGFNTLRYDLPITTLALAGASVQELKKATVDIIENDISAADILRRKRLKKLQLNHIDLIEVAPLFSNLKIYGGRMHIQRMQDLPFHPDTVLSRDQIAIVRNYCANDLNGTQMLYEKLNEELELRDHMSTEYGMDLRSKSDAQIAEAVISHEVQRLTGNRPSAPIILPGTLYRYWLPPFIQFQTPYMQEFARWITSLDYVVGDHGSIIMPDVLKNSEIAIGDQKYVMKIGGLHSTEKTICHLSNETTRLTDFDVTSYYPFLIMNQNLYPEHIGPVFLDIFSTIVRRRIEAKVAGMKKIANTLKITINGTYGKLGNRYSIVYSPQHLIQVTLSGQLTLLSLIERMELAGVKVVSANTDGVMAKYDISLSDRLTQLVKEWELFTGFDLESHDYYGLFSRDVNNYLAVKKPTEKEPEIECKGKGAFARTSLAKNPDSEICVIAVEEYLKFHTPVEETIRKCNDIRKFAVVRTVKGGAVKEGEYLGKSIRWYYSNNCPGEIVYATTGNKVPMSDNARPMMELPNRFPDDVEFEWYISEARSMLAAVGLGV